MTMTMDPDVKALECEIEDRPYMTHDWVDRAGLAAWLEGQGIRPMDLPPAQQRWFTGRRDREPLSVGRVDQLMVTLYRHLSDIPDELWIKQHKRSRRHHDKSVRADVVAAYHSGRSARDIEGEHGVPAETIHKWAGPRNLPQFEPRPLAAFLRELDHYRGLSKGDRDTISHWAVKGKKPTLRTVQRILGELSLTLDHLPTDCWSKVTVR
jgi:hypothetical protein